MFNESVEVEREGEYFARRQIEPKETSTSENVPPNDNGRLPSSANREELARVAQPYKFADLPENPVRSRQTRNDQPIQSNVPAPPSQSSRCPPAGPRIGNPQVTLHPPSRTHQYSPSPLMWAPSNSSHHPLCEKGRDRS
jgi:hypothetical protein